MFKVQFFKNFKKIIRILIVLGDTKGLNLKSHEMIAHLLYSYSSDKQFYVVSASEALAWA